MTLAGKDGYSDKILPSLKWRGSEGEGHRCNFVHAAESQGITPRSISPYKSQASKFAETQLAF